MKRFFCLLTLLLTPQFALADETTVLDAAVRDAQTRMKAYADTRFSFHKTIKTPEETVVLAYDPTKAADAWSLVSGEGETAEALLAKHNEALAKAEETPDRDALVDQLDKTFAENGPVYVREDPGVWVYRIKMENNVTLSGGGRQADVAKHMTGEIYISKTDNRLTGMRFFAPEPLRPVPVAKVKKMDIRMSFTPVMGADGPLALTQETTQISGSAMFKSFSEDRTVTRSDFRPVAP